MASLYDTDILAWSEEQARRLRQHADAQRRNDVLINWGNIIEEIESVGNEQLHAIRSLLMRSLQHMLEAAAWPLARDAAHWPAEARRFRIQAADRLTPSMRQTIDLAKVYAQALRIVPENYDGQAPLPLPNTCPLTLDELLNDAPWIIFMTAISTPGQRNRLNCFERARPQASILPIWPRKWKAWAGRNATN